MRNLLAREFIFVYFISGFFRIFDSTRRLTVRIKASSLSTSFSFLASFKCKGLREIHTYRHFNAKITHGLLLR